MYRWRTEPNGLVVVALEDGSEKTPTLVSEKSIAIVRNIQAKHGVVTQKIATKWGLMVEWLRSMEFQESGGNPRARNPERKPGPEDDGVGLLQITNPSLKNGYTDEQLCDPETNLNIGARYIVRSLVARYGWDFPKISASFNAGSVHPPLKGYENEWGMHCTPGHIDAEVSALNWQLLDVMGASERAFNARFGPLDLLTEHMPGDDEEPTPTDPSA